MDCRFVGLDFDIAASAGWYSAIAGLLAGFALLSILLPLDHESQEPADARAADSVVVFTCAFFSLLILAFNYAILAGRTGDGPVAGVAAHEQLLNGAAFGLSTLLLLLGLRAVLRTYGVNRQVFQPARNIILLMTAALGPVVALSLQFSNALDLERYRGGLESAPTSCGIGGLPDGVWVNLAITVVALTAVLGLAALRHRLPRRISAPTVVAKGVLGVTVLITGWSSLVVPLLPPDVVTGAVFEHLTLAATGLATVMVAAAAWLAR